MTSGDDRRESPNKSSGRSPRDSEGERSEPSDKSSGERSEPRDSEGERSEPSKTSSGERSEPRDSEPSDKSSGERSEPRDSAKQRTDGGVPLDIAGHESRSPPGESDSEDDLVTDFSVTEEGADDGEVEPVELLVQMADDDEIDPWDIDIVAVTDEFLDRLDGADLRSGGRALFYASVLLRMKSDAMLDDGDDEEWDEEPWDAPMDEGGEGPAADPFAKLESEMERRLDRKHARGTPQTLDELVRELRERERETRWKESRTYDTSDSPRGFSRGTQQLDYRSGDDLRMDDEPTEDDAFGNTHQEHIEDVINDVYVALHDQYDGGRDEVLYAEIEDAGDSRVETFLALLFLAHRGQVHLEQDDMFGDLWVQDPAAVDGERDDPEEAHAGD